MVSDFIKGLMKFGIPSRVRADHGSEFVHVEKLMTEINQKSFDIDNAIHLAALHYVFPGRILEELQIWMNAHNNHPVRTIKHQNKIKHHFNFGIIQFKWPHQVQDTPQFKIFFTESQTISN